MGELAMWSEGTGPLELIAHKGRQAPGTEAGVSFSGFSLPSINTGGQAQFSGGLTGPGVTPENDRGIWLGNADSLSLLVRKGDPAPGIGPDVTFDSLNDPFLNESGRVAFGTASSAPVSRPTTTAAFGPIEPVI